MGLIIAGVSSGSGKTTLTIGLMRALKNRGLEVSAFKAGPDYIDPMFHRLAIKGPSYNLPTWMVPDETLSYLYDKRSTGKDISIVEGVMGYFDGHSFESIVGSTAHLADSIESDVILIMDASSMALTAAALLEGLVKFHEPTRIKGIVFNKIKSNSHYVLLKNSVETHTRLKCYGYLKPSDEVILESRHLGLVQANEDLDIELKIEKMAALVEETVDVTQLFDDFKNSVVPHKILKTNLSGRLEKIRDKVAMGGGLTLGIASDKAFSFYYDENLEVLREIGVTLSPFSPLVDAELPAGIDALYIGGGYPEVFAKELMHNKAMRTAIKTAADAGLPIYAECGGLMYLMQSIEIDANKSYEMVGFFEGQAKMTRTLQHFGHVEAALNLKILGQPKGPQNHKSINSIDSNGLESQRLEYRGHEFHHSKIQNSSNDQVITVKNKQNEWQCGYYKKNTLATYVHNHFFSNLDFLEDLVDFFSQNR